MSTAWPVFQPGWGPPHEHGKGLMGKLMRAIGLMSGTSLDGIDVAFITTDGEGHVERGPAMVFPYGQEMRDLLRAAIADAGNLKNRRERLGAMPHAERELTEHHGAAVSAFLRKQGIVRDSIDVIGFHGQTVLHKRPQGENQSSKTGAPPSPRGPMLTIQLGLGEMLAELTRIPVVYDLRAADAEAGGQGAPLVPVYHQALAAKLPQRPLAVLNIGGVANVTWIGRDGRIIAFDTGPGNALIDDLVHRQTGEVFDACGARAAMGKANDSIVHDYLSDAYFSAPPPKSLDRNAFTLDRVAGLSNEDGLATLTAFTSEAIARAREHMPEQPELWIVCGGGRRNKTLMGMLAAKVENAVVPAEAAGLDGDSLEAEAWAYLAVRSLKGLAITFPGTTGVAQPMTGGRLAKPKANIFAPRTPANED
ncbi:MAG: anhydro-N-acetylmuramic acid kinase [Hyphomicrobium sp.]